MADFTILASNGYEELDDFENAAHAAKVLEDFWAAAGSGDKRVIATLLRDLEFLEEDEQVAGFSDDFRARRHARRKDPCVGETEDVTRTN